MITEAEQARFWKKVDKSGDCWVWTGSKRNGYGLFRFRGPVHTATRIAWEIATGEKPDSRLVICHKCDNPSCVNPAHLFQGSRSDNTRDSISKKRFRFGNARRLSEQDIVEIIETEGVKRHGCRLLAKKYGVSFPTIWKHRKNSKLVSC